MSVHRYDTADGTRWRVRWRDGGKMRSRSCLSKTEADGYDAEIKARRFRGEPLPPQPGTLTLAAARETWSKLRLPERAPSTQQSYEAAWKAHIEGKHDGYRLSDLTGDPQLLETVLAELKAKGVGPSSRRKVLTVISAVLTARVEWNKIGFNPAARVEWPNASVQRLARPLPPIAIERVRRAILERESKDASGRRQLADACIVSLLAYAGLRPGEVLALDLEDVGKRWLAVDKGLTWGDKGEPLGPTKTKTTRSVPLVEPLADDLREWRGRRETDGPILFPAQDGGYWSLAAWNNWRGRVWAPAARTLGDRRSRLAKTRPYDCRGSFVSLQLRGGADPLQVAEWAGHSPAVMFRHYANVIRELEGEPRLPADEQIRRARDLLDRRPDAEVRELIKEATKEPTYTESQMEVFRLLYG